MRSPSTASNESAREKKPRAGGTVVVGLVFVGLNLLSDLLYRVFDPRARSGEE